MKTKCTLSLFDVVKRQFFKISKKSKIDKNYLLIVDKWEQITGGKLNKLLFPVKISKGSLYVEVVSAALMSQTAYLKKDMQNKLQTFLPNNAVKDIKFFIAKTPNKQNDFEFISQKQSRKIDVDICSEEDPLKKSLLKLSKHIK